MRRDMGVTPVEIEESGHRLHRMDVTLKNRAGLRRGEEFPAQGKSKVAVPFRYNRLSGLALRNVLG